MKYLDKLIKMLLNNSLAFIFFTIFVLVFVFSIIIIFDLKNINPFLYFEF